MTKKLLLYFLKEMAGQIPYGNRRIKGQLARVRWAKRLARELERKAS